MLSKNTRIKISNIAAVLFMLSLLTACIRVLRITWYFDKVLFWCGVGASLAVLVVSIFNPRSSRDLKPKGTKRAVRPEDIDTTIKNQRRYIESNIAFCTSDTAIKELTAIFHKIGYDNMSEPMAKDFYKDFRVDGRSERHLELMGEVCHHLRIKEAQKMNYAQIYALAE